MALFRPIITSINNLNSISFKGTYVQSTDTFTIENNDRYHDSISFCSVLDSYIMCDFSNYLEGDIVADYYCSIPANIFSNTGAMITLYATIGISDFVLYMTVYGNGKRAPQPLIYEKGWDSNFNDKNPYVFAKNNISFSDDVITKGVQTVTINNKSYNHTHVSLSADSVLLSSELGTNSYYFVDSAVTSITLDTTSETTSQNTRTYENYDTPAEGLICYFDLIQNRGRDLEFKQKKYVNSIYSTSSIKKFDKTLCKEGKRIKMYLYENNWISLN